MLKYITLASLILGVFISIFAINQFTEGILNVNPVKVGYYDISDFRSLDPADIKYSTTSNALRTLYSTLLYYDRDGQIRPGLASRYEIRDTQIKFFIRQDIKTKSGKAITAKDAYISFLRLLILNRNTHGNLNYFLHCRTQPTSLTTPCPAITHDENSINFTLKSPRILKYFLNILVNPDFSIIPESSINKESPALEIADFSNTSGPYYVDSISENEVMLKANQGHYLIKNNSPMAITMVGLPNNDFVEAFVDGRIDVIPTFSPFNEQRRKRLLAQVDGSTLSTHKTLPIKIQFLRMYNDGPNRLNRTQRLELAVAIREKFTSYFKDRFALEPTHEFFSGFGGSVLSPDQLLKIKQAHSKNNLSSDGKITGLTGAMAYMLQQDIKPFFDENSLVYREPEKNDQILDFEFRSMDAGFFDNASHLSYCQSRNYFNMTDSEFSNWLDQTMNIDDPALQIKALQDLHFKILSEGYIIPIGIEPYYAFARKPWKLNAYKMYAGSPLWMIEHE